MKKTTLIVTLLTAFGAFSFPEGAAAQACELGAWHCENFLGEQWCMVGSTGYDWEECEVIQGYCQLEGFCGRMTYLDLDADVEVTPAGTLRVPYSGTALAEVVASAGLRSCQGHLFARPSDGEQDVDLPTESIWLR